MAVVLGFSAADAESPATVTPVTPVGVHSCGGFYPEAVREAQIGGVVGMAVKITPTGAVSEVSVARSSGNSDLDEAAQSCVRTWRYLPAQENGKPVAKTWTVEVSFKPEPPAVAPELQPVLIEQDRNACLRYPFWAQRHHAEGNTTINYTVGTDGGVSQIVVAKPSGDDALDEAAKTCVSSFKFRPVPAANAVSAQATWSYIEHGVSSVQWAFTGTITASMEANRKLRADVEICLKKAAGRPEFASGLGGTTMILVRYVRGTIKGVSVLQTSGNDGLDRFAADCFRADAADSVHTDDDRRSGLGTFPVIWRQILPL